MEAQMFQDKLAGRSPQGRGEEVREGEAEFPLFASAWSQALPPQTPGMPARIINQQQEACGYMFVVELDFTWRPQLNGKYTSVEVNFGGL